MSRCHCGRKALYGDHCYSHAPGMAKHRSRSARRSVKTARTLRVKLCRNELHAMTPANTLHTSRGPRCRACKQAANKRYAQGHAKPTIRTAVVPFSRRRPQRIPRRYTAAEMAALEQARGEYQLWLGARDVWSLAELATEAA